MLYTTKTLSTFAKPHMHYRYMHSKISFVTASLFFKTYSSSSRGLTRVIVWDGQVMGIIHIKVG